ncbi:hypothetical protein [Nocardia sp. NPDC050175]|uniref:hypothetical protein n=1 Tax=Nocardia sp. NPDC050175 TaxID=3364317 RepID=UPI0037919079
MLVDLPLLRWLMCRAKRGGSAAVWQAVVPVGGLPTGHSAATCMASILFDEPDVIVREIAKMIPSMENTGYVLVNGIAALPK